jgi:hypothetical protein
MTGDDFIAFSGKLAANPAAGEAGFRSASSRAYYGAFHLAMAFLAEIGTPVPANAALTWRRNADSRLPNIQQP